MFKGISRRRVSLQFRDANWTTWVIPLLFRWITVVSLVSYRFLESVCLVTKVIICTAEQTVATKHS